MAQKLSHEKQRAGENYANFDLLAITAAFKARSHKFSAAKEAPYFPEKDFRFGKNMPIHGGDATMCYCARSFSCGIVVRKSSDSHKTNGKFTYSIRNGNTIRIH